MSILLILALFLLNACGSASSKKVEKVEIINGMAKSEVFCLAKVTNERIEMSACEPVKYAFSYGYESEFDGTLYVYGSFQDGDVILVEWL